MVRETSEQIANGIRIELRSIIRQWDSLRRPFNSFRTLAHRPEGEPRYYVLFDNNPRRRIRGLKAKIKEIKLPDERIHDEILHLAQSVWHLKDRLNQLAKAKKKEVGIEALVNQSVHLQVCSDLANEKKHGRTENRSGVSPKLSLVKFNTSMNGTLEFFYDGVSKEKELLVTNPVPIPYTVDILINDGKESLGDAVEYICKAFDCWLPTIRQLDIVKKDDSERKLVELLYPSQKETSD